MEYKRKDVYKRQELGMNLTTAFNIFVRQSLREGGIPFEVRLEQPNNCLLYTSLIPFQFCKAYALPVGVQGQISTVCLYTAGGNRASKDRPLYFKMFFHSVLPNLSVFRNPIVFCQVCGDTVTVGILSLIHIWLALI